MSSFNKIFSEAVKNISHFPGIGKRSAERIAFSILKMKAELVERITQSIKDLNKHIKPCKLCNNFSTQEVCSVCSDTRRKKDIVCVVEEPTDIMAIEKTSQYKGLYYVLLGSISPLEGINEESLNIGKLVNRVKKGQIKEVIISTDPDTEGELTAQYVIQKLSRYKVKIYRIAIGVPLGTKIEYIDSATLGQALTKRQLI
ncbi:MAG: recombination mediator RecR [Candidatus Omnitrophica bacterium]|nr:recombination mediator RecR [Candidatus Omnitrophota bacterium]